MGNTFYKVLGQMVDDALVALQTFEATGANHGLNKLKAVAAACLDGSKLESSIREDLGPRRLYEFQEAVSRLARTTSFTSGLGRNTDAHNALLNVKTIASALEAEKLQEEAAPQISEARDANQGGHSTEYVHRSRIEALRAMSGLNWDLKRLIRLLEELNLVHAAECHMATAMLVRAIADHIPPVFNVDTFEKVANNYSGAKSFKASMKNLQNSLRHIADSHLHAQIRNREVLPTERQVDFRADLDVLLGEIVRILSP